MTKKTVLIIDDHPLFRKGVAQLISLEEGFTLVGEAASGKEGISIAIETKPDLILLDLNMSGMDGIQTLKAIKEAGIDSFVIMLTVSNAEADLVASLKAGADGYLLKDIDPEDLIDKLYKVSKSEVTVDESLVGRLAHAVCETDGSPSLQDANFTDREQEILACIVDGLSNKLISHRLDITEGTVKVHVKNVLRKLNLRSRLEIAVWAFNQDVKQPHS